MDTNHFYSHSSNCRTKKHSAGALLARIPFARQFEPPLIGASCNYWLRQTLYGNNCNIEVLLPALELPPADISPIGIELLIATPKSDLTVRQQIDLLEKEMAIRATNIGHRPVNLITLRDPSGSLGACEITEMIFMLGQHFNLNHNGKRAYTINTPPKSLNENYLALLKGIGFNRVEFNAEHLIAPTNHLQAKHLEALRETLKQLSKYDFPEPSWEFRYGLRAASLELKILDHLLALKPPRVNLLEAKTNDNSKIFTKLFNQLLSQNYNCIGNDCFVEQNHPIDMARRTQKLCTTFGGYNSCNVEDWVGLGPGLNSQIGNVFYRNHTSSVFRNQALANLTLPIVSSFALTKPEQEQWQLINQINAYHAIDTIRCKDKAQIDTEALVKLKLKRFASNKNNSEAIVIKREHTLQMRAIQAEIIEAIAFDEANNLFP